MSNHIIKKYNNDRLSNYKNYNKLQYIEFQNNLGGPTLYEGGNTLTRKNISTTSGSCDVLDLVLIISEASLFLLLIL